MGWGDIRIKLTEEEADLILDRIPGGRDPFLWLSDTFIMEYEQPDSSKNKERGRSSDKES